MPREYWYLSEGGPLCTERQPAQYILHWDSDAVQNILCWLVCYVHNGPPSPKFQILPSQLRQTADRVTGLSIKGLWSIPWISTTVEFQESAAGGGKCRNCRISKFCCAPQAKAVRAIIFCCNYRQWLGGLPARTPSRPEQLIIVQERVRERVLTSPSLYAASSPQSKFLSPDQDLDPPSLSPVAYTSGLGTK
jgi:hypothetical protein